MIRDLGWPMTNSAFLNFFQMNFVGSLKTICWVLKRNSVADPSQIKRVVKAFGEITGCDLQPHHSCKPSRAGPVFAGPAQVLDRHAPQLVERLGVASQI